MSDGPSLPKIKVLVEGDDDRALVIGLQKLDVLPARLEPAKFADAREYAGGWGKLVPGAKSHLAAGTSCILIRDLDDLDEDRCSDWFHKEFDKVTAGLAIAGRVPAAAGPPVMTLVQRPAEKRWGKAVCLGMGLPDDIPLRDRFGLTRHMMDDYILRALTDSRVFDGISELREVPYEKAMIKLSEVRELFRSNEIPLIRADRLVFLLRAIANFGASPAAFVGRILEVAGRALSKDDLRERFSPLADHLRQAIDVLSG